jgi:hypothetical protein
MNKGKGKRRREGGYRGKKMSKCTGRNKVKTIRHMNRGRRE